MRSWHTCRAAARRSSIFMTTKTRRRIIALLVAAVAAIVIGRQALYLDADPAADKDCSLVAIRIPRPAGGLPADERPEASGLRWAQRGGGINDVSCLNPTPIDGIVDVR